MSEMLMTEQATTTTEGSTSSQGDANAQANAPQTQQATVGQNQQPQANSEGKQGQNNAQTGEQANAAPVTYEFKPPEGKQYDSELIGVYSEVAKDLKLSPEAAQKILDKMAPTMEKRQLQQIEEVRNAWANDAKSDSEFGGDRLNENLSVARKSLDAFGTPALRQLLNESGLGNHPEVIRFMYRAGKSISEDRFVGGGQGGKPKAANNSDLAASLYPSQQ